MSIASICLPSIFSFVKRGIQYGPYSLLSSRNEPSLRVNKQLNTKTAHLAEGFGGLHDRETSVERLYDGETANHYSATAFKSPSGANAQKTGEMLAMDAIRVQKDMNVESVEP